MPRLTVLVSTRTMNLTVAPVRVVVVATFAGRLDGFGSGTSSLPPAGMYMYVIFVGAVQVRLSVISLSVNVVPSGSLNRCVSQMNGLMWGPEVIGPLSG